MKKDKEDKKENKTGNNKEEKKENLGKYFLLGILVAGIIYIVFTLSDRKNNSVEPVAEKKTHVWSAQSDSEFVKICYDKYRSQVKDDLKKQENTKTYCRCMLEKMKTEYGEDEVQRMTDSEIKKWDTECRDMISNPEYIK
ncbi:MAG TPA: hypothetical protein PKD83_07190 [Ignavibacteria bacterium]|nr:hypothetical protein [Ignavibacteria bacterium]